MDHELPSCELLKTLRKEKRVTLRLLSERVGVSPTFLCRVENGAKIPEPDCLRAIADALGLQEGEKSELLWSFGYMEF